MRSKIKKFLIVLFWLVLWQAAAIVVAAPLYFVGPLETVIELFRQAKTLTFWLSVSASLLRITAGFLAAALCGALFGVLAYVRPLLSDFLSVPMRFLRSVPVAAVVVILLIWWGPKSLVLCISFMVVFPNIYGAMLTGLKAADGKLLEMAKVFKLSRRERFFWIYREAVLPQLDNALCFSLGLCFKAGIAAEIIGLPKNSLGEQLYRDKIYLNTAGVFAWIVVVLILYAVCEKLLHLFLVLLSKLPDPVPKELSGPKLPEFKAAPLHTEKLKAKRGDKTIAYTDIDLASGAHAHILAPSGAGKTTLLMILAHLYKPESGMVMGPLSCALLFQEDRLVERANALRNLDLAGCRGNYLKELEGLLEKDKLLRPVAELSGGERRRVAIARALLSPSPLILLDEPFTGLDEACKIRTAAWLLSQLRGRTLIVVSHEAEDASLLDAEHLALF